MYRLHTFSKSFTQNIYVWSRGHQILKLNFARILSKLTSLWDCTLNGCSLWLWLLLIFIFLCRLITMSWSNVSCITSLQNCSLRVFSRWPLSFYLLLMQTTLIRCLKNHNPLESLRCCVFGKISHCVNESVSWLTKSHIELFSSAKNQP